VNAEFNLILHVVIHYSNYLKGRSHHARTRACPRRVNIVIAFSVFDHNGGARA